MVIMGLQWPSSTPLTCSFYYRPCSLAKQGDNALGSIHLSVSALTEKGNMFRKHLPLQGISLCVCSKGAFVDNHADVVDWFLITQVKY